MQLTRDFAKQQTKRILANPMLAAQSDDGLIEIIDCLMRHCSTREHAERTMTEFLDTAKDPKSVTAELTAASRRTRDGIALPEGCANCRFESDGAVLHRSHVTVVRGGYEYARRCSCPRGQALAVADRKRDAEIAAMPLNRVADPPQAVSPEDFGRRAAGDRE